MGAELPGARSPWPLNFVRGFQYVWVLSLGLACFLSPWSFEIAPRFSQILYSPVLLYFLFLLRISLKEQSCYYLFYL